MKRMGKIIHYLAVIVMANAVVYMKKENMKNHVENATTANDAFQPCHAEDMKYGRWVKGAHYCGLAAMYHHPLTEAFTTSPRKGIPPYADWCWQPHHCMMDKFSVDDFCAKLNGRSILVVGDSLQHQFYDALFMQLETPDQPMHQWYHQEILNNPQSGSICKGKGGGRLHYLRNDHFSVNNVMRWNRKQSGDQRITARDWKEVAHVFDFIILNKGAHYATLSESERVTRESGAWLQTFLDRQWKEHQKKVTIFYRTTPPGSPHCQYDSPVNTTLLLTVPEWFPTIDRNNVEDVNKYFHQYNWDSFPVVNNLTLSVLQEYLPKEQLIPLHVAEMTSLRPDTHRCYEPNKPCDDELHYFLPSVVDTWVHTFYHLMPPNNKK